MNISFISKDIVFPLILEYASWNFATLTLSGKEWFLNSEKSWSVYKNGSLMFDDSIESNEAVSKALNGLSVLSIENRYINNESEVKIFLEHNISILFSGDGEFFMGKK